MPDARTIPIAALNATAIATAKPFGVLIADGFGAFAAASAPFVGDACAAGLLSTLPTGVGCDVHPSRKGSAILANTVLALIGKNQ